MGLDALSSICKWNPGHLSCESQGGRLPAWHRCCHDNTHTEHNVLIKIRLKARNKNNNTSIQILHSIFQRSKMKHWNMTTGCGFSCTCLKRKSLDPLILEQWCSVFTWLSWFPNIHTSFILRPHTTSFVSIIQDAAMLQIFIKLAWRFLVINFAGIKIKKRRSRKKFRLSWFSGNLVAKQVK